MSTSSQSLAELRTGFADPGQRSRPMMRWWWFGPDVARADIERDLQTMRDVGIGGVELAVVYPLSERTDRFMSDGFLANVRFAADHAASLGMRFDITLGSGWSFGGPDVSLDNAARRLWWERREIGVDEFVFDWRPGWPGDELVAVYIGDGSLQEPPLEYTMVPSIGGSTRVPRGLGPRVVLIATARRTGQQVKRAAAGAEGPVFDHYSLSAVREHIAAVCDPLLDSVDSDRVGSVFCDSLEAYAADWTPRVLEEFRRSRGYDALPLLPHLHTRAAAGDELRADYYLTLTELYEENFVRPLQQWAHGRGVPFRIQGYGEPPAGISSFRHADLFEGEGWGWKELTQSRWATSAAHLYDRRVVSSEIWTWVHSPSFRATPLDLRGELHEHALLGVNHFIGHGWPCTPIEDDDRESPSLGRMLYASGALDARNPWWPAMPALMRYTHRLAWIMRQGAPAVDVALYAGTRAAYATMFSDAESSLNLWQSSKDVVGDALPTALREAGYDFDAWDDDASRIAAERYPAVVLPDVGVIPDATLDELRAALAAGRTVIAIGRSAALLPEAQAAVDPAEAVRVLDESIGRPLMTVDRQPDLGITRRQVGTTELFLLANTGATRIDTAVLPRTRAEFAELWSLLDGTVRPIPDAQQGIAITLEPYEAVILVTGDDESESLRPGERDSTSRGGATLEMPEWEVSFPGTDTRSVRVPHRWEDTPERAAFSGTARYTRAVDIPHGSPLLGDHTVLDFGDVVPDVAGDDEAQGIRGRSFRVSVRPPVGEVAEVRVNGEVVGVVWGTPYRLHVGAHLRAGTNTLEIEVANTNGNWMAHDPRIVADAEGTRRWYGRRFTMQDFDRAGDRVASGLLSVPVLRASTP